MTDPTGRKTGGVFMKKGLKIGLVVLLSGFAGLLAWANAPHARLPEGTRADRLVIEKEKRLLHLYSGDRELRVYPISLGREPVGAKTREGDNKTPEGFYQVCEHKRDSSCHRALRVSYPAEKDRALAAQWGVSPGGNIMIHGLLNGLGWIGRAHRWVDWTAGCIAVTNPEMDELFDVVSSVATIEIRK